MMDDMFQYINGVPVPLDQGETEECSAREQQWTADADARMAEDIRAQRDNLLQLSDVALLRALENGESGHDLSPLRAYRQYLRDIPAQDYFPATVSWPILPKW
jgi:hypothetical protein